MKRISLMLGVLLAVAAHPAIAQEDDSQRIARACADDAARLCRVPLPRTEDFKEGGIIYSCLQKYVGGGQLSRSCWHVMLGGGR
jgi:hypothetical protein